MSAATLNLNDFFLISAKNVKGLDVSRNLSGKIFMWWIIVH